MKRYHREEDGDLYDRKMREYILVDCEARIGDHYYINDGGDELVIAVEDVEE